jgi:hypothetical protein
VVSAEIAGLGAALVALGVPVPPLHPVVANATTSTEIVNDRLARIGLS